MIRKQIVAIICLSFLFAPVFAAQVAIVLTDTRQEAWAKETLNNSDLQTNIDGKQAASANLTSINQDLGNTDSPAFNALTLTGTNTLSLGTSSSFDGMLFLKNATNANTFTIETGVTGAAIGWITPPAAPGGANYLLNVDVDGTMGYTNPGSLGGAPEGTAVLSTGEVGGTKYLREDGDGTSSWQAVAGGGDVSKVGTPADSQVGVWTGDGTIEGASSFTYDGSNLQITGDIGSTGTRITKGWFTDLEITNGISVPGTSDGGQYLFNLEDTDNGTNYTGWATHGAVTTSYILALPVAVPTANQILQFAVPGNQTMSDGTTQNVSIGTWTSVSAETNSLETTITGIEDAEIFIGNGADSGTFTIMSGDGSLSNTGVFSLTQSAMVVNTIGNFTTPITSNPYSFTAANLYNSTLWYGATGEIDIAAGVDGMATIIYNTGAFTITIDPNGSEVIVREGTAQTGGVSITLSSGAGNFVALVFNGTQWVTMGSKGTLAEGT